MAPRRNLLAICGAEMPSLGDKSEKGRAHSLVLRGALPPGRGRPRRLGDGARGAG